MSKFFGPSLQEILAEFASRFDAQGYPVHKKTPNPLELHRALGMVLLYGPRGRRFLMSEVSL